MKKISVDGFKISLIDQKAFGHYSLQTPREWSLAALEGMKNKAKKTILKDYFESYKSTKTGTISGDIAVIILDILAMPEFKNYNFITPEVPLVSREQAKTEEIWDGGFDIEDYEYAALNAFYANPEKMLYYFMENKIYEIRKAFIAEHQEGFLERKEDIPVKQDDFITLVCSKPEYKSIPDIKKEMACKELDKK